MNLFRFTIGDDFVLGVVGNKSDLFLEQEIQEEEGAKYAEKRSDFFTYFSKEK